MMEDLGLGILISMRDAFSANAANVESSMQSLDATIAQSSARITQHLDLIQQGATMMGAGAALAALPAGLVAMNIESERLFGELASLGVTSMGALDDAVTDFTNRYARVNADEIIAATYDIKSALSQLSDDALAPFATTAALTAKATKGTIPDMVGTFTTAYGIFRPLMRDMTDQQWAEAFSGALSQTVQSFKTTGTQMAEAIKNVGATAAASNIPLNEQLAILGQLQTTMPGSEAGTLYKAFIMKAAEAGETLGLSFVGPTGQLKGIIPILEAVKQKFPDLSQAAAQVQIKKAFGSDEAVKFLLQMSAGMDTLGGSITAVGNAMRTGTTVTEKMAQAMNRDIGAQLSLIAQQTDNLLGNIGQALIPYVIPLLQGVQFIVLRLQDWSTANTELVTGLLATAMAIGGILLVAGGFLVAMGTLGLLLPAIQTGLAMLPGVLTTIGTTLSTVGLTVLRTAPWLAAIGLAAYLLYQAWQTNFAGIRDVVTTAWTNIKAVFMGISQLIRSFNGETGTMSAEVAAQLERAGLYNFVVTVFQVYARVRSFLEGLWQGFSSFFGNIRAAVEPSVSALVHAFGGLFTALGRVLGIVQTTKVEVTGTTGSWRQFGQTVGEVLGFVAQVIATVLSGAIWVITGVVRVMQGLVTAIGWVRERMTVVANAFVTHWGTISSVVKWAAVVLGTIFGPALIQTGIQATIAGARIISNFVMGLQMAGSISLVRTINQIQTIVTTSWSSFIGGITGAWQAIRMAAINTAQYAVAGWRAVGALVAQGAQWVALQARTVAANAALLIQRGIMLAGAAATGIATAATTAFGVAMTIATGPIGLICLAIAALIGIGILVWKNWDRISAFLVGCWNGIKQMAVSAFTGVVTFLKTWGPTILAVVAGPVGWIALAIAKNWERIKSFLSGVWSWMKNTGGAIWDGVKAGASTIGSWCSTAWNGIKSGAGQAWEGIKSGVSSYVNFHAANLTLAKNIAVGAWDTIANGHGSLWDRCKAASSMAVSQISAQYPWLGNAMQSVGATIAGVWASIRGTASSTWSSIKGWATSAWDGVKNAATGAFQHLATGFTNQLPNALEAGKKLMTTLAEGIRSAVSAPFEALKAGLGKLGKLLPHSDAELGPLSMLTQSGFAVLDTMSRGIAQASHLPALAMEQAFAFGNNLPAIMPPTLAPATAGTPAVRPITPVPVRPIPQSTTTHPANEPVRDVLELIASKLDALGGNTPGDMVVTLDGREIARAVYRDLQERRIRNYDNR